VINRAEDWYAQGYRIMKARDIFPGDDYLVSYVEQVEASTCSNRRDVGNGYVDIDGVFWYADMPLWVRKHT
jgi:hypothetical protein